MRIASWNIAGGHTVRSLDAYDYNAESLSYFTDQLQQLDPDVICLQETHSKDGASSAATIAKTLGSYTVINNPLSQSHIDSGSRLGIAMLARDTLTEPSLLPFPLLAEELHFKNGQLAPQHEKALQTAWYKQVLIANTHLLPLIVFNRSYEEGSGAKLAQSINNIFASLSTPLILCGDFGMSSGQTAVFGDAFAALHLKNALPTIATHYRSAENGATYNAPDAIYYSQDTLRVTDAGVIATQTDHYLCWADIEKHNA